MISAPAVSHSSAEMRRGGKWWIETLRLGIWWVAHLRAGCAALSFVSTGLTGQWTGLTGGCLGQVAPSNVVVCILFLFELRDAM